MRIGKFSQKLPNLYDSHFYLILGKERDINPKERKYFMPHISSDKPSIDKIMTSLSRSRTSSCIFQYFNISTQQHKPEDDINVFKEIEVSTSDPPTNTLKETLCNSEVRSHIDLPTYTAEEVKLINEETIGQSENNNWKLNRLCRITASNIHEVYTKTTSIKRNENEPGKTLVDATSLVNKICYEQPEINVPAMKYGKQMESEARNAFISQLKMEGHKNVHVEQCGLYVYQSKIFIAGSPDGIICCKCCSPRVLEIKCPFKSIGADPQKKQS